MPPTTSPTYFRHIHIPSTIPFTLASVIQNHFFTQQLAYKALTPSPTSPLPPPPPPTILTFTSDPVYTLGRREKISALPKSTLDLLRSPLNTTRASPKNLYAQPQWATIEETQRGGQTTFHGPGQGVIYPILDIKSPFPLYPTGLTVRSYVHHLEESTIATLRQWGIKSQRTEHPGVWDSGGERKIAALGVHFRRNISSFGVGLNVSTDLRWFERIVACGLEGKSVTSMKEIRDSLGIPVDGTIRRGERKRIRALLEAMLGEEGEEWKEANAFAPLKSNKVMRTWVKGFAKGLFGEEGRIRKVPVDDEEVGMPSEILFRLMGEEKGKWREELDEFYN